MTGKVIDGHEAHRIGFANRIAPADELDAVTEALANELLAAAPRAVGMAKRVMDAAAKPALAATLEQEVQAQEALAAHRGLRRGREGVLREAPAGVRRAMSIVRAEISVSLDGFGAGPNQSTEDPLGEGGERLHDWVVATESWRRQHGKEGGTTGPDSEMAGRMHDGVGAFVMGRGMFGGGPGPWEESWHGWWGERPAVPRARVRAHAPSARAAGDAGRHHVPLRDRRDRGGGRPGPRRGRRRRRPGGRRPGRHRSDPRRRPARRAPAARRADRPRRRRAAARRRRRPKLEPRRGRSGTPAATHLRYRVG